MQQSSIFPIYLKAEYRADGQGFARFQSEASRAAQAAKREFDGVRAAVDAAVNRQRNSSGALDLGVDEMRRAAAAQQQVAAAAREVAEATKRAALAAGTFDTSMSRATRAAFELASAEDRVSRELLEQVSALDAVQRELDQVASKTEMVTQATRRGTTSTGQQRQGLQQLSFQLNDVATMFALGARPQQIFASQSGQIIQAVQLMTGGTSRLAAFLGGPWGIALTSAVIVLSPFIGKLLDGEDASDGLSEALGRAKFAADGMTSAQSVLGNVIDLTTGKIKDQTAAAVTLARAQLQLAEVKARVAADEARSTLQSATARTVQVDIQSVGTGSFGGSVFRSVRRPTISAAAAQRALGGDVDGALDTLKDAVDTGKTTAAIYAETATAIANLGVETENIKRFGEALKALEGDQKALQQFIKPERASRARSGSSEARELERLAEFGEAAEERIARLNERFDAQPRLIDAAAQATRELDAIIAELQERKPLDFAKLVDEARQAQETIREALARPIEDVLQLSRERLQIEGLIAAGQVDEALALREILRLQDQIGELTEQQGDDIRAQIRLEQQKTRELRAQAELLDLQANVARTVADSLKDLLSGRSTDFFGSFRQALQDLQGARLFEDIFGSAFRDLEQELSGNTPQGRANAAYVAEVERTAGATRTVGDAALSLADAFDQAFSIVNGATNRALTGAANDNGISEIVVQRNRTPEVQIARLSINDLAARISGSIGASIGSELEDVFGPRFASLFGDIVGGAIAGKVLGGDVGSLLGGATKLFESGVLGNDNRISTLFGKAGEGAAVGTQIADLSKLLGIKGSNTGAQIGGAIGSVIPVPGGNIIGAIAGNILGGLLKGTPRGSATIGGLGSGLGVTGVVGNKGSLKDASGNLAGSVLEAIDRIADQLGASVDASRGRVSIGQRKDNLRVDPRGGGATKIGNGAIDFGQDAEAAIAFAVRDLINDGVITGLKASEQRLLKAGSDIEAALSDVLTFRGVFDQLEEIRDPVGGAIRKLNREFEGLIDLFGRAGASADELADLEDLYGLRRAQAIEDATSRIVGTLQGLLSDLRIGDNGLSLRSRRGNAVGEFDALAARVAAGDSSAFDDFSEVSQQLLDIERQLFGSTQSYFDRLAQITQLTEQAIADQTNVTSIGNGAPSPFGNQVEINRAIDIQTNELGSRLDAIIANQIAAAGLRIERGGGGGGGGLNAFPALIQNF